MLFFIPCIIFFSLPLASFLTRKSDSNASGMVFLLIVFSAAILMLVAMFYLPDFLGIEMTQEHPISSTKYSISAGKFFGSILGTAFFLPIALHWMRTIEKIGTSLQW